MLRWALLAVVSSLVSCGQAGTQRTSPTRDYRRAAAAYSEQCAAGCGDLAACRALFDLEIDSRGVVPRVEHVATLTRMCERRDALGCFVASWLGLVDGPTAQRAGNSDERCAAGDPGACEVELMFAYFDGLGGPFEEPTPEQELAAKLEARMNNAASKLCRRGLLTACEDMVEHETFACRLQTPAGNCVADVTADRRARGIDPAPLVYAWVRVLAACRDGDPDACALVPGHEPSAKDECNAGDYSSCAELGAHGDAHAAKIACDAGVGTSCTPPRAGAGTAEAVVDAVKQLRSRCDTDHDADACRAFTALRSPPPCAASGRGPASR